MSIVVDIIVDASADSIRAVGEADLLDLAGIARSTWLSWCRKGLLSTDPRNFYGEAAVIEAVVARLLVAALDFRRATAAWRDSRSAVLNACITLPLGKNDTLDLVVDLRSWEIELAHTRDELHQATRTSTPVATGHAVLPLGPAIRATRRAFRVRAKPLQDLKGDKRRKPKNTGEA